MLDINFIRKNPKIVKETCRNKKVDPSIVDQVLDLDKKRRSVLQNLESLLAQKNKTNKEIVAIKDPAQKQTIIARMKKISTEAGKLQEDLRVVEQEFIYLAQEIPNLVLEDVPIGRDARDNKIIRRWGRLTSFDFKPKDHMKLGENLDIIDTKKAAKITGSRFAYLKNAAALLEIALIHYTFDILMNKKIIKKIANSVENGYNDKIFTPVFPPAMIRPDIFRKMARLSESDKDERYYLQKDNLYLVGSAEHTLGPMHMNEILAEEDLPIRYAGFTTNFRREAGSYGKDVHGILRMHQFDKIEMLSFTAPENSRKEQDFFVAVQEYLVQSLKIPYQVVIMCTGDMSGPDARQIDIECWMPSQNCYRETHTADLMTDYQARRLNTRLRRRDGKLEFVHMNDATAFAIGRTLIAIFENYQRKDGSIKVPKILQKYSELTEIKKK
ncbi:MAG: serine--tRNA ligase [Patescibacteria group bacterium]